MAGRITLMFDLTDEDQALVYNYLKTTNRKKTVAVTKAMAPVIRKEQGIEAVRLSLMASIMNDEKFINGLKEKILDDKIVAVSTDTDKNSRMKSVEMSENDEIVSFTHGETIPKTQEKKKKTENKTKNKENSQNDVILEKEDEKPEEKIENPLDNIDKDLIMEGLNIFAGNG